MKLLEVPADRPSMKVRVAAFKKAHGILTHRAAHVAREDNPWIAVIPFEEDKGKELFDIMANSSRLYEETRMIGFGAGELSAIRHLMEQRGADCDL